MPNYYFVGSLLPELHIGFPAEISFKEFDSLLKLNLTTADYEKTVAARRFWDVENLRSFWKKEPLDSYGNLDENQIEDSLLQTEELPAYVRSYLEKYDGTEFRLKHFSELMGAYFCSESEQASGFLKWLLELQREVRLVLVAFRAKKLGRDLEAELQFEDPEDPFVAQLLAFKDAPTFEPPEKYEDLKTVFLEHSDDPMDLHRGVCEYMFYKIDEKVGLQPFTLERILGYLLQLILVEKWLELNQEKGIQIVDRFVKEKA